MSRVRGALGGLCDGAVADAQGADNQAVAVKEQPLLTEDFSGVTHVKSRCRHRGSRGSPRQ